MINPSTIGGSWAIPATFPPLKSSEQWRQDQAKQQTCSPRQLSAESWLEFKDLLSFHLKSATSVSLVWVRKDEANLPNTS